METKFKLNNLLVTYQNDRKQYLTEEEFIGSLNTHSFVTVESLNAKYERGTKPGLIVHINKVNDKNKAEWQAFEINERLSFVFNCSDGTNFISTIERRLDEELEKHDKISPLIADREEEKIEKMKRGYDKFLGS
jgi:hypothetical protein